MKNILKATVFSLFLIAFSCGSDDDGGSNPPTDPTISSISPTSGPQLTVVTITGTNFGTDDSVVNVFFNGSQATVSTVTDTSITATAPNGGTTGPISVDINGAMVTGPTFTYVVSPNITGINPESGPKDTLVTISGENFGTDLATTQVAFNGVAATVESVSETEITAIVPAGAYTGIVSIVTDGVSVDGPTFTYEISDINVSTLAGSVEGFADGVGDAAQFDSPWGIARASNGDLYIADRGNNLIRKVTADGTTSTFAGSGVAGFADGSGTSAQFNAPYGIDIDSNDNLYISDYSNNRIRKITPNGDVSTLAGNGNSGFNNGAGTEAEFNGPLDLAVDSNGNVFVSDEQNDVIRLVSNDGTVTTFAGSGVSGDNDGISTEAQFNHPDGIAIDRDGNVYIGDALNHKIRKITPNGDVSTLAGSGTAGSTDGTGESAEFNNPTGLYVDETGNIFVAGNFTHKIRKVTPGGLVSTFGGGVAGDLDGDISEATFSRPADIIIGDNGTLYISEKGNHKIRVIIQD